MFSKFEAKFQEIKDQLQTEPIMRIVNWTELRQEWNVDRFTAQAFSAYATERNNGKSEAEAEAYCRKSFVRASFEADSEEAPQAPFADTPEAREHFEKLVRGR